MELYSKTKLLVVKKALNTYFLGKDLENIYDCHIVKGSDSKILDEKNLAVGDEISCYFYIGSDKKEHLSLKAPLLEMGKIGFLECKGIGKVGAFFDVGYDKDVMMPFSEKLSDIKEGDKVLVKMYLDKSSRPCVSQKIKRHLKEEMKFKMGDEIEGIIYAVDDEQGVFIALEDEYFGLILTNEMMPNMKIGKRLSVRVTKVREDGRYNVSPSKKIPAQMDEDSESLLQYLRANEGFLPFDDSSDKDVIREQFNMSKRAFKRAVGRLLKGGKIELVKSGGIRIKS